METMKIEDLTYGRMEKRLMVDSMIGYFTPHSSNEVYYFLDDNPLASNEVYYFLDDNPLASTGGE